MIEFEQIIQKKRYNFDGYVYDITVDDIHAYPIDNVIVHNSGAGSLVNYALNITQVDPLQYNLIFERFLNPDRGHLPDIDSDFGPDRSSEVFDHLNKLYGVENCCNIITFGNLQIKALIKDISRIYGVSVKEMNDITKLVPDDIKTIDELLTVPDIKAYFNKYPGMFDHCKKLHGLPRNTSQHPAGICIAPFPVTDVIPVCNAKPTVTGEIYQLGQFEKEQTEAAGLVKLDILRLLSIQLLYEQVDMLKQYYNIDLELKDIPLDDTAAWDIICNCDTLGVFQMETTAKPIIKKIMPRNIEELSAVNAFVRPGASGLDSYCLAKKDKTKIKKYHPIIDKLLEATYGSIVYQEDIMHMVATLLDISFGKADIYRRALEKPHKGNNQQLVDEFIELAVIKGVEKGIPKEVCEEIRKAIIDNSGYGFNKSHSICYSIISYWQAYMKAHYPELFYCSLFNSESVAKLPECINEAKKHNVIILPPMINKSEFKSVIEDVSSRSIRMGLNCIKGIGEKAIDNVKTIRPFDTINALFDDYTKDGETVKNKINKTLIECTINIGAADNLPIIINKNDIEHYLINFNDIYISSPDDQSSKIHIEEYDDTHVSVYLNRNQLKTWYHLYLKQCEQKPIKNYLVPVDIIKGKYLDNFNTDDLVIEKKTNAIIVPEDKLNLFGVSIDDVSVTRCKPKGIFKAEKEIITMPKYQYVLLNNLEILSNLQFNSLQNYLDDIEQFEISFINHPLEKLAISGTIPIFDNVPDNSTVTTGGIITALVPRTSKKGTPFWNVIIRTPRENVRCTVWNKQFMELQNNGILQINNCIKITGTKSFGGITANNIDLLNVKY